MTILSRAEIEHVEAAIVAGDEVPVEDEADLIDTARAYWTLRDAVLALADEWDDWRTWEGAAGSRLRAAVESVRGAS